MQVRVAESAGFCFGVQHAVDKVYEELNKGRSVYTFGPIMHNETVVAELEAKGVKVIDSVEEVERLKGVSIIIRSHGVPRDIFEKLDRRDADGNPINHVIDATCAFVKKIHRTVEEYSQKGWHIIIVGDPEHPEVRGICGWCSGPYTVLDSEDDARALDLPHDTKICLVSQTTYNFNKFEVLVEILKKIGYSINVVNTICNATEKRQRETLELARSSDAMIVIGSKNSSNTRKLFEISSRECINTYYIQTHVDLDLCDFTNFRCVGITAGASTPKQIIKEVQEVMSEENFEQMLEDSLKKIHNGEVVEGTVISVKEDQIALNIGYKADGIITRSEYTNDSTLDLRTVVHEGDTMTVKIIKVNDGEGQVILSYRKLAAERGSKRLEEAFENKEVLKANVVEICLGGIVVIVDETRVFIPASLVSDVYEKDLNKYKDQEIEFVITEFNPKKRRIIGDRKQLLVAKKKEAMAQLFEKIKVGDVIEGKIKNITDFGAFVDLGGAD